MGLVQALWLCAPHPRAFGLRTPGPNAHLQPACHGHSRGLPCPARTSVIMGWLKIPELSDFQNAPSASGQCQPRASHLPEAITASRSCHRLTVLSLPSLPGLRLNPMLRAVCCKEGGSRAGFGRHLTGHAGIPGCIDRDTRWTVGTVRGGEGGGSEEVTLSDKGM